jgi:VCBS repeat-containing protein
VVNIIKHDLEFILRQIKIAEAHATGTPLNEIRVDANGNVTTDPSAPLAIPTTLSPYGLRTVDGSYNNLVEGRDQWGAADNAFLRITDPFYRNEADDSIVFGAGSPGQVVFTDGNYAEMGPPSPQSMGLGGGTVVDADPRIISNLIVDQTLGNPAAIYAALTHAGVPGEAIIPALAEIRSAYMAVKTAKSEEAAAPADEKAAATAARMDAEAALDLSLAKHGVEMDGNSVVLPNVAPDEGLSAPYNGWFTLFGQFFDHGLDLVTKGGNGTVYIPLQPDDPLYNPATPHTNFMALTRAPVGAENLTTPWVDQNQTYTSHSSHQLFLREYAMVNGKPLATGKLLEGDRGLATWADVKEQAKTMLGVELTDADISNIPLFVMDEYGEFVRGPNGLPQLVTSLGADNKFGGGDDVFVEGSLTNPISTAGAVRTGHAFLDDIAHAAVPVIAGGALQADGDTTVGYSGGVNSRGTQTAYDNELLDAHYITGDGRGNENIGLSAVHHIFHSEHNHTVEQVKTRVIESGDLAFLNEWLLAPVDAIPTDPAVIDNLPWDGERLFQAARFTTEMQYQHLVFEEFARKVQPDVDAFVFNASTDINPAIFAEFAHVVYRFGHSMLTEKIAATNADGSDASMDLFQAFLNPLAFGSDTVSHDVAAGAIIRGMTSQVGNEIDEFVTSVLRDQLVGIPLDLAALNIARGRDTGMPSLNSARAQFKAAANDDSQLDPYTSWMDFALNLKNPASIVNFIAAYGTHSTVTSATTVEDRRDAAMKLVFGDASLDEADRQAFLNGTGNYATKLGGLDDVDLWVGGMAEKKMAFGGMLGSTFSFVFELQMENLQNADRLYYLSRVQGLNLLNELENNSLAKMVLNNTDLGETGYALPGDIFSVPDHVLYMDAAMQEKFGSVEPVQDDPFLEAVSPMVERIGTNYIRVNTNDHVLIQGTNGDDTIIAGGGDDSAWGRDGNDRIEAGYGVDRIHGGRGDDIITNSGTDIGEVDMLHGEEGNDVIHAGSGLALVFGNEGQDFIITGPDGKEAFGGTGNDFILGGEGGDFLLGNEGDDWIEAGNGFDTSAGDNSELNFNSSIIGHDVMFAGQNEHDFDAESGDDIMVQGESVMRNEGMFGFDWAIHKGNHEAADSDLTKPIFTTDEEDILRDRFDQVEALSGWKNNDILRGDNRGDTNAEIPPVGADDELNFANNELSQAGVDRITGLRELLGDLVAARPAAGDLEAVVAFDDGNILLGGGGSDLIEGRGGDDFISGDHWLNVRIGIYNSGGEEIGWADSMAGKVMDSAGQDLFGGKSLSALMLDRTLNPGQLKIIREILDGGANGDVDTAVFSGNRSDYTVTMLDATTLRLVDNRGIDSTEQGDIVSRVEKFQFADGIRDFEELANRPPVISVIGAAPAIEDGTLVTIDALAGVSDPDAGATLSVLDVPETLPEGVSYDADTHSFTLDPANAAYQYLAAGQTATVTVGYGVSDGSLTTAAEASWVVTGTNDVALISGIVDGGLTEDAATNTVAGILTITDPDTDEASFVAPTDEALAGTYGTFGFNAVTGAWTYTLDNTLDAVQGLGKGETVTDTLTLTSMDTTSQVISVSVLGVDNEAKPDSQDLNGDGMFDVLWRLPDGSVATWELNGAVIPTSTVLNANPGYDWEIAGTGNFGTDGRSDILWRHSDGSVAVWQMDGAAILDAAVVNANPGNSWQIVGTGDFSGDGKSDILWRHTDGSVATWQMDGAAISGAAVVNANPGNSWQVAGTGDFDSDGKSDILWQHTNGAVAIWRMDGSSIVEGAVIGTTPGTGWKVEGVGDATGDGKTDILWWQQDETVTVWEMDGTVIATVTSLEEIAAADWQMV